MIAWNSEAMLRYMSGIRTPQVEEFDRCVNEGAVGCTVKADERGWCPECWSTIAPTP